MDMRFYLSLFMRRIHWFILIVILCAAAGTIVAQMLPTVYRAEARLVVEAEQIPGALAASTVQTQASEQLQIIQQRIMTRDILVEMANRLDIYSDRRENGDRPLVADEIVEDLRNRIQLDVSGSSRSRRGPPQATIVTVSFEGPTAALVAAVTNEIVTLILREDVAMRTGVARETLEFFKQEVDRLDREMSQKSAAILAFKEGNLDALPDSLEFRRNQQAAAQERLLQLSRQEAQLNDQKARMIRLNEAALNTGSTIPNNNQTPEQKQLQSLKSQQTSLLVVLSPENPRVKMIQSQIESLEQVVATQIGTADVGANGQLMTAFDIQMADLDGQIDYITEQKVQAAAQIERLNASIAATPGNSISLDALTRDFAAVQAQYDQAIVNKAKAETGDTIEALSKGQRISVIEQAIAPRSPTSPNRPLISAAGAGGGILLGLLSIGLLEFFKGSIRRPSDLTEGLGITPFATLPYLYTEKDIRQQRLLVWGGWITLFVALIATLWSVHTFYMPLDLLFDQIAKRFG